MAWGTFAERRAAIEDRARKAEARAKEHRAREASYRTQGKPEKAEHHAATAARQEQLVLNHRQELDRLAARARQQAREGLTNAERAHEMARAQERAAAAAAAMPAVDPLQAYTEALEAAVSLEEDAKRREASARAYTRIGDKRKAEIASGGAALDRQRAAEWREEADRIQSGTSRDLARELETAIKAKARAEGKKRKESNRLKNLDVVENLATAAAQREIASGGAGRGTKVASLRDYAALIRKPQERTQRRLKAMEEFDTLCATADEGLFPEPKFEHESGSGKGPGPQIMLTRAAGLAELQALTKAIGAGNTAMLRAWIYERSTLTALVRAGYGTEKAIGALALAALDAAAKHFTTPAEDGAHRVETAPPSQPRPSVAASPSQSEHSDQLSDRENASPAAPPAGPRRRSPEIRRFWSNHLPEGDKPERPTVSCPEEISDATRRTIRALSDPDARA